MATLKAPRLRRGDVIGLVSPASAPQPPEKTQKAVLYFESLGYRTKVGRHATDLHGYLAGKDSDRAEDFNAMVRDPKVRAIFATRGGYGSPRLLDLIDYSALKRNPKIVVGFSDITALQCAIFRKTGLITFSGPLPAVELCSAPEPYTEENFWRLLTRRKRVGELRNPANQPLHWSGDTKVEGPLLGGNLSLIASLLGTPFSPSYRKSILVLEDVGEEPYRIDRMFTHLRNAGILRMIKGLVLGQFTGCENKNPEKPSLTLQQIFADFSGLVKGPVVRNLQYGHVPRKLTLPFGARARVDARREKFEILESAVC
jgi:muramoyltetrapeptide carboxypeptidase